ncbi:hypothetical protein AX15_003415 [Amanita polypyramis BW_CC]|nr:hypothetical protein AX15_003415 [Amanita polypyramis BW_CC]
MHRFVFYSLLCQLLSIGFAISQSSAKYHISNSQYYILSDGTEKEGDVVRIIGSPCPPFDSVVTTDVEVGNANYTVTGVAGKGDLYVGFNGVGGVTLESGWSAGALTFRQDPQAGTQLIWTRNRYDEWVVERTPSGPPYR